MPPDKRVEIKVFHQNNFVDITPAVTDQFVNPAFQHNPDLLGQVQDWPVLANSQFCLFSVPTTASSVDKTATVHHGMGRGLSSVPLPTPGSPMAQELARADTKSYPGQVGIFDKRTGFYYVTLGAKGNGPTANEMANLIHHVPDADYRRDKDEPWGVLREGTTRDIEYPTLDYLAQLGFRVGQVVGFVTINRQKLAKLVMPRYQQAGLSGIFNLTRELEKRGTKWSPAIAVRLGGGVKTDLMSLKDTPAALLSEGMYCFASEIASLDEQVEGRGVDMFMNKYKFPPEYREMITKISDYDYSQELDPEYSLAYFSILSFLVWRNFHMQDEYNHRCEPNGLGPLWLNYKPGDWDISGYFSDVDVFLIKRNVAETKGVEHVRYNDFVGVYEGLGYIAQKLENVNPDLITQIFEETRSISTSQGFLLKNFTPIPLYSENPEFR